jgi:hypothetical protein
MLAQRKRNAALERKIQREIRKGTGIIRVEQKLNLGTGTVHRIKREMEDRVQRGASGALFARPRFQGGDQANAQATRWVRLWCQPGK